MLILNYLGQGAWVLNHADMALAVNPFFAIMPQSMLFFAIIMATGAAIIASQALISGTFSILSEAMNLHFWPRMRIKHPTHVKGQLYIPMINFAMYIAWFSSSCSSATPRTWRQPTDSPSPSPC